MKRLLLFALASVAVPAAAQTTDNTMPGMDMGQHAGHQMPASKDASQPQDQVASEQVAVEAVGTDQAPGSASPPPIAHNRPADRYYDPAAMAEAEMAMLGAHASPSYTQVLFNLAEYQARQQGKDGYRWDAEAWLGDLNRLVIKSQGEGAFGEKIDSAELQALYSRALDPWWNFQLGVRHDFQPKPSRTYATVGLEGLAPYHFHALGAAFLSERGDLTGRLEGSYDQRITQRLIFQPRVELNLSAQNMPEQRIGAGLSDAELGLRLRYEVAREFSPYVGVSWTWKSGKTADYARLDGKDTTKRSFVFGIRTWF